MLTDLQHVAYSLRHHLSEMGEKKFQDGALIKKDKNIHHNVPRPITYICHLSDPLLSHLPYIFFPWGRILGHNWDNSLRSFPPCSSQSPLLTDFTAVSKSGLKLVRNVKTAYGSLRSENSQDYAQKPQRNWTFMNSALVKITSCNPYTTCKEKVTHVIYCALCSVHTSFTVATYPHADCARPMAAPLIFSFPIAKMTAK
jgi:hypothetical protein